MIEVEGQPARWSTVFSTVAMPRGFSSFGCGVAGQRGVLRVAIDGRRGQPEPELDRLRDHAEVVRRRDVVVVQPELVICRCCCRSTSRCRSGRSCSPSDHLHVVGDGRGVEVDVLGRRGRGDGLEPERILRGRIERGVAVLVLPVSAPIGTASSGAIGVIERAALVEVDREWTVDLGDDRAPRTAQDRAALAVVALRLIGRPTCRALRQRDLIDRDRARDRT